MDVPPTLTAAGEQYIANLRAALQCALPLLGFYAGREAKRVDCHQVVTDPLSAVPWSGRLTFNGTVMESGTSSCRLGPGPTVIENKSVTGNGHVRPEAPSRSGACPYRAGVASRRSGRRRARSASGTQVPHTGAYFCSSLLTVLDLVLYVMTSSGPKATPTPHPWRIRGTLPHPSGPAGLRRSSRRLRSCPHAVRREPTCCRGRGTSVGRTG